MLSATLAVKLRIGLYALPAKWTLDALSAPVEDAGEVELVIAGAS
jgi:hypothetical protein